MRKSATCGCSIACMSSWKAFLSPVSAPWDTCLWFNDEIPHVGFMQFLTRIHAVSAQNCFRCERHMNHKVTRNGLFPLKNNVKFLPNLPVAMWLFSYNSVDEEKGVSFTFLKLSSVLTNQSVGGHRRESLSCYFYVTNPMTQISKMNAGFLKGKQGPSLRYLWNPLVQCSARKMLLVAAMPLEKCTKGAFRITCAMVTVSCAVGNSLRPLPACSSASGWWIRRMAMAYLMISPGTRISITYANNVVERNTYFVSILKLCLTFAKQCSHRIIEC